jgi:NAD-dependent SIR2 family protein deacetylase
MLFIWQGVYISLIFLKPGIQTEVRDLLFKRSIVFFGKPHPRQFVVDSLTVPHQTMTNTVRRALNWLLVIYSIAEIQPKAR